MRLNPTLVRRTVVAAVVVTLFSPAAPSSNAAAPRPLPGATYLSPELDATTSTTPVVDDSATAELHRRADARRRVAGHEELYARSAYGAAAKRIALASLNGEPVAAPSDGAPYVHMRGTTTDLTYATEIEDAVNSVVTAMSPILKYPTYTDGGWSVVVVRRLDGRIGYGVALVVGWPAPALSVSKGCTSTGYCWSNGGLHPHLPWTRNTVKWHLSTSNLPSAGESLVKSAIAQLNAVPGFGADLVYGGRTTDTGPTAARRFVVVFGSGCGSTTALGCTITTTQGANRQIFQAKTIITLSRYRAKPTTSWWVGTLMHEIAHGVGLGHYDQSYYGSYQLMRSAGGPDVLRLGDKNGLRRVAPGGALGGWLTPQLSSTGSYNLVVHATNNGLGGIRAIRTQCTDANGAWQSVRLVTGKFDGRGADRVVGQYAPPAGTARNCRALVRSKSRLYTTPSVTVRR